jgi:hypothetical protein
MKISADSRISASSRRLWLALAGACLVGVWTFTRVERGRPPAAVPSARGPEQVVVAKAREPGDEAPSAAESSAPPSYRGFLDALTREFPFGRERQGVLREMLEGAPPEAVEALLRLSFGTESLNDISHVLIERLAELAPGRALAFAREMRFGVDPPWWHSVIGGLADPRLVLGDILALPASDARTNYLGHLTLQTGLTDPDAALRFALAEAPAEARGTAIANAVFAAARRDPMEGFDLALLYGEEAGDPALVRRIAVDWALDDYAAASARILAMEDGAARRRAVEGLAAAAIARDPVAALDVIAQVGDAATREALLVDAGRQLYLKDRAAAEAWLAKTPELGAVSRATLREFATSIGR